MVEALVGEGAGRQGMQSQKLCITDRTAEGTQDSLRRGWAQGREGLTKKVGNK